MRVHIFLLCMFSCEMIAFDGLCERSDILKDEATRLLTAPLTSSYLPFLMSLGLLGVRIVNSELALDFLLVLICFLHFSEKLTLFEGELPTSSGAAARMGCC